MCGILGIVIQKDSNLKKYQLRKLLNSLFTHSETRGKDATGIALWDYDKGCIKNYKNVINSKRFIKDSKYIDIIESSFGEGRPFMAIGHCRLATNGDAGKAINAQPISNDAVAVVHNGIIVNCNELEKYGDRTTELDSELIFNYIQANLNVELIDLYKGLYKSINGMANLLSISSNGLVASTNNGSLYHCESKNKDMVIWASERRVLKNVIKDEGWDFFDESTIMQLKPTVVEHWDGEKLIANRIDYIKSTQDDYHKGCNVNINLLDLDAYSLDIGKIKNLRRCKKCLLPETMPYIQFDEEGICNYCHNYKKPQVKGKDYLLKEVHRIRNEENGIVLNSFSGGRDSSYSLYYLKEILGLDVIAYSYDWGMVTDLARRNQSRMCSELGVEFIIISADIPYKRDNIRKNIVAWLKKPALGMVPLFMAGDKQYFFYANEVAKINGIKTIVLSTNRYEQTYFKYGFCNVMPTILNGNNDIGTEMLPLGSVMKMAGYYIKEFATNVSYINSSLVDTGTAAISNYFIPHNYLRLFDYINWNENEVNKVLCDRFDWETRPGNTSTWRIGDGTAPFYNLIYYSLCGFTENDCLRSNQIRAGLISREEALNKVEEENKIPLDDLKWYFDVIGLDADEVIKKVIKASPFRK